MQNNKSVDKVYEFTRNSGIIRVDFRAEEFSAEEMHTIILEAIDVDEAKATEIKQQKLVIKRLRNRLETLGDVGKKQKMGVDEEEQSPCDDCMLGCNHQKKIVGLIPMTVGDSRQAHHEEIIRSKLTAIGMSEYLIGAASKIGKKIFPSTAQFDFGEVGNPSRLNQSLIEWRVMTNVNNTLRNINMMEQYNLAELVDSYNKHKDNEPLMLAE